MNNAMPILELRHLERTFKQGESTLTVLKNVNLSLKKGEFVALVGPSGSGKSTLLQLAGLLEHPSSGEILIQGRFCSQMSDKERTELRARTIGYVYQFHHLLPEFTALENIVLPQMIVGTPSEKAHERAYALLQTLHLENRASHRPSRLSGGEQQRVAILRALANHPSLLIADEPTGNLDENTAQQVFEELMQLTKNHNMAALVATHNLELAKKMDRIIFLQQGVLKE
jgi:lipoprotein-releasing system ATP-binding protein